MISIAILIPVTDTSTTETLMYVPESHLAEIVRERKWTDSKVRAWCDRAMMS